MTGIYAICCAGDVAHVRDAVMDVMADESYHLASEANQICYLKNCNSHHKIP